jgi:hypothetical protein
VTDEWPFDQPPNCAVFTLHSIIKGDDPILYVSHDADDEGWQFLNGKAVETENAALVSLGSVVKRDPSVLKIADLPPGWTATRTSISSPWQREQA